MTLVVPMPPNLANRRSGGSHWRTIHREKGAYVATLDALLATRRLPAPPSVPWERATIASVMHLGAAMDDDNAMARHKWLCDWLKSRGYVTDDRKRNLTWAGFPEQRIKRGAEYRIVLTLHAA